MLREFRQEEVRRELHEVGLLVLYMLAGKVVFLRVMQSGRSPLGLEMPLPLCTG